MGFGANSGFDFIKEKNKLWRKKTGFGANGGFDFTKKLKEMLRKKMGFWPTVDLKKKTFSGHRNRTNSEEKRWGLEPMVDLILLGN